ncbi:MAG: TonB-dependent receptor plug domain-containing protein [Caulobacter sp.]|nr:TonB-dependent receptor plug domain-containing protein [Caulobacter sp.]
MRIHRLLAASAGLALLSAPALAAELETDAAVDVEAVIVTRLPSPPQTVLGLTTITADDIAERQAAFAADVLNTVPGVSLSRNGAFGGVTTVRMRGAPGDKTLVLVDGVVQNDASSPNGGFDFSSFDLADVERVEILAGPQGSLWGSDAIGGVISFTTREADGWRASLEGGSFDTLRATVGGGVSRERFAIGASAAGFRTDGISKAANGTEADGFESWTASVNGRVNLADRVSLEGRVRYNRSKVDLDGYDAVFAFGDTADQARSTAWTGFARLKADDLLGLDHALTVSVYDLTRDSISAFSSSYDARRTDWRWTAGRGGARDRLAYVFGVERDDTEASISTGATADLGATSAFGVVRVSPVRRLTLTAALRYDDPDDFDAKATARLSATGDLGAGFAAQASWGQGFKTPTISQAVCDFCFPAGPSTGLRPETAEGWDLGLSWRSGGGRVFVQATGYDLQVRDQIAYGTGRYVNIDRTRTTGMTLSGEMRLGAFQFKANYGYTDAVDDKTGARLLRVPEHAGAVSLGWRGEALSALLTIRAEGEQADSNPSTFAPQARDGFVTADLAGGWRVGDRVELTARIENLADERYQETLGYGEPGRAVYLGVKIRN